MNVEQIVMRGFMRHVDSVIRLPPKGVVLITGPNGGGKSSIIEAVATGGWNETLRGTPPWSGDRGEVEIMTDAVLMLRKHRSARRTLEWQGRVDDPVQYESPTKAQQALERAIGRFEVWRRTCVFSSADASHFTMASDGERKRLLEALLGLERFDAALDAVRADRRTAEVEERRAVDLLQQLKLQLDGQKQRVSDAERVLATVPPVIDRDDVVRRISAATVAVSLHADNIAAIDRRISKAEAEVSAAEGEVRAAERSLAALGTGVCLTCGQALPQQVDRTPAKAAVDTARASLKVTQEAVKAVRSAVDAERKELTDEQATATSAVHRLRSELVQADGVAAQHEAATKALENARKAVADVETRIKTGEDVLKAKRLDLAKLGAVEQVLGLKGVRAHVLGKTLGGIEEVANSWLSRLDYAHMRLRLSPYTEKKTGGISDAIALEVEGAGGGHGYRGASAGERRRIDVALLFALAEVAEASHGVRGGCLFVDEAFDALDEGGVDAVRDALVELAEERCIVVITHSRRVIDVLPVVSHFNIDNGAVHAR